MDFTVLADHSVKLNENEKRDKNLDLTREPKNLWNIKGQWYLLWLVHLVQSPKDW